MDKDEKIIEAINYWKEQLKMLSDSGLKGVLFHLAITCLMLIGFWISLWFIDFPQTS